MLRIRIQCFFDPWIRDPDPRCKKIRIRDIKKKSWFIQYFRELNNNFMGKKLLCQFSVADPG
jgi:hypothetical protein